MRGVRRLLLSPDADAASSSHRAPTGEGQQTARDVAAVVLSLATALLVLAAVFCPVLCDWWRTGAQTRRVYVPPAAQGRRSDGGRARIAPAAPTLLLPPLPPPAAPPREPNAADGSDGSDPPPPPAYSDVVELVQY